MAKTKRKRKEYKNYNGFDYNQDFWGNHKRDYEDFSDRYAINSVLENTNWLIDLGGGFGRLIPTYKNKAKNIILTDTSAYLLKQAVKKYGKDKSIHFVCASATKLPFKKNSIDSCLMFRVLHTIPEKNKDNVSSLFSEIDRVISKHYYLEFPNKRHILKLLRYLVPGTSKSGFLSYEPEQVNESFYNFTFPYVVQKMKSNTSFKIDKIVRLSFFRHRIFKKTIPLSILTKLEAAAQKVNKLNTTPSILIKFKKETPKGSPLGKSVKNNNRQSIWDILACPECGGKLDQKANKCKSCGFQFSIHGGVIDFHPFGK